MKVIDQDTGLEFHLGRTPEYNGDIDAWAKSDCRHDKAEIRKRTVAGGAIQFAKQCVTCGVAAGSPIKHSEAPADAPSWDQSARDKYSTGRKLKYEGIVQKHVRIQRSGEVDFRARYAEYLKSDAWRSKRAKVLKRAGSICEACLDNRATQVHHLTYDSIFNEFLFELVAVCGDCHGRLHPKDEAEEAREMEMEWRDGFPCDACRFNSEEANRRWCGKFDVLAIKALSADGECGPKHKELEPLK